MGGIQFGPQPTTMTPGYDTVYGRSGGGQMGQTWGTPTGDVYQQTLRNISGANPFGPQAYWDVQKVGRTLEGQQFDFNQQRWQDVLGMMKGQLGSLSGVGGGGGTTNQLPPAIAAPSLPGRSAAPTWTPDEGVSAQAFARAKDNVGRLMASGERDVRDLMGSRGIGGSGLEAKALAALRNEGLRTLAGGELERNLANEGRRFDMSKLAATLGSQERAQDIAGMGNIYATQVSQRGQQPNYVPDQRLQILSSLIGSIGGLY